MKNVRTLAALFSLCVPVLAGAQGPPLATLVQGRLAESGAPPFYLQAVLTESTDPSWHVDFEMSWAGPNKWRRTIKSKDFSQTVIVNGDRTFEQDSDDYIPHAIQVSTTALVDPTDVLGALKPGDNVRTKANGKADESGKRCFDREGKMCVVESPYGLLETLGGWGHWVDFTDYHKFKEKRIARLVKYHIEIGDIVQARITMLGELKSYDESQFAIANPTPRDKVNHTVMVSESELRSLAIHSTEIVWPQILDDPRETGLSDYYICIDRTGHVREIIPLRVSFKQADDSVRRQIMKWVFRPVLRDGVPVQAEAVLNPVYETRKYGPALPLTDAEVRKLATGIVAPEFPPTIKSGARCDIRIAVDADGHVIEQRAGEGSPELTQPCMKAIGQWHFSPIVENGQALPYRAEVLFWVP